MADILIRGVEMPRSCMDCWLNYGEKRPEHGLTIVCTYSNGVVLPKVTGIVGRLPACGILELPEHGDLIDAESLADDLLYDAELADRALSDMTLVGSERDYMQSEKDIKQNCAYYVSHAPVVIPSNKEDTE